MFKVNRAHMGAMNHKQELSGNEGSFVERFFREAQ